MPKISIVTPSFNQGDFIEETICSVLDQGYPNLEYMIMDGGSSDQTVEIIQKYEKYLSYWESAPDRGQTHAINKGFSRSSGDVFNWLNSDDLYEPRALLHVGELFAENPVATAVCGKEWGFYDRDKSKTIFHAGSIIKPTLEETVFVGIIDQPCTFFKRNAIEAVFPLTESLRYVMDKELWIYYLAQQGLGNIVVTDRILTWFRIHEHSKSGSESDKFQHESNLLHAKVIEDLGGPNWFVEACCENMLSKQTITKNLITNKNKLRSNELFRLYLESFLSSRYIRGELKLVRKAARLKWRTFGFTAADVKLLVKAFLIPHHLLKVLRSARCSMF